MIKAKSIMECLSVKQDLELDNISEDDISSLQTLYRGLIQKKQVKLNKTGEGILMKLKISNILLFLIVVETDDGYFKIYDYFNSPIVFKGVDSNKKEFDSSIFVILDADNFLEASNINYNRILDDIRNVPMSGLYANQLNMLGLESLIAFDRNGCKDTDLLLFANELYRILSEFNSGISYNIIKLNILQTVKRQRKLNDSEIDTLCGIVENPDNTEDMKTAASILMDNYQAANNHFLKMDINQQEKFKGYPIMNLWPKENFINTGILDAGTDLNVL